MLIVKRTVSFHIFHQHPRLPMRMRLCGRRCWLLPRCASACVLSFLFLIVPLQVKARINAMLAAQGVSTTISSAETKKPEAEVEINDSPNRYLLTKRGTHDEVRITILLKFILALTSPGLSLSRSLSLSSFSSSSSSSLSLFTFSSLAL